MVKIEQIPWNGMKVVSTFSGCGGSCLGYRMAGFRVVWASEFVPAAADSYDLNHPTTVDRRDIRTVDPAEILEAAGLVSGELDLFDGSPPCASFSQSGKREKYWGKIRKYSDTEQRTDDLFDEYIRILRGLMPRYFIAENVPALASGSARGYLAEIHRRLSGSGYRVGAYILDASRFGVPQRRRRLFLLGGREDQEPLRPPDSDLRTITLREALRNTGQAMEGEAEFVSLDQYAIARRSRALIPGETSSVWFNLSKPDFDRPCPTITATNSTIGSAGVIHPSGTRKLYLWELRRVCGFPDDFAAVPYGSLKMTYEKAAERLGRAVPPLLAKRLGEAVVEAARRL